MSIGKRATVATICACFVTAAWADCGVKAKATGADGCSAKAASATKCCDKDKNAAAAACKDKKGGQDACCSKALAATGAPVMMYKVGEETTKCPKQAGELSKGDDAKIRYIVGDSEYTDKMDAMRAYATALENHLATVTAVRYAVGDEAVSCPQAAAALAQEKSETMKYRVASFTFPDKAEAEKAAKAGSEASENVTMKMVVEGQTVTCSKEAEKACGVKKVTCHGEGKGEATAAEYIVGETKTTCAVNAKIELAKARIAAAYQAIEQTATKQVARSQNDPGA